ncbi:hypothetical protein K9N68_34345 (plasmid) [Kovacikia minuta CCNUW1]|uniref:hypothetical protein n=1 Tax=Kovacikia minuta TaxID=2931930 RepID=UPI001CCE785B|nr:hypothetical protein [Kovacikia minuta]UBF30297.1 hypothetical protein K9N68_34345 [Kovacikia minuta CCNUW1]
MQQHNLAITLTWAIAVTLTTQSAAWSLTPPNPVPTQPTTYLLALQPSTSGVAASQSFHPSSGDNSGRQLSTAPRQLTMTTETNKRLNVDTSSSGCSLTPQASGVSASKQLDAVSSCKTDH